MKKIVLLCMLIILITSLASCTIRITHTHDFETVIVTEATCTKDGWAQERCKCGAVIIQGIVPATGHTCADWVIDQPATTTEDGKKHAECAVCGDTIVETIPAIGSVGLAYTVNDDGKSCTISGIGTCTDSHVAIPAVIDGYNVTAIANRAFYECTTMTAITIPESVKSIGTQIFYKAENLHTVYYNSTYASQDNNFMSVASIKKVIFGGKLIPDYALYNCANIETVEITSNVNKISFRAFQGCAFLTNINIPNSVTSIGNCAFEDCISLTNITIPDSVTKIGSSAFEGCTSLQNVTIPNSVTSIYYWTFMNCTSLTSITIPDSVTFIEYGAFSGCTSLTSINIPDTITSINDGTFRNCSSLASIVIPDSVTSIGGGAFSGCSSLTSIIIPDSVTSIGEQAFYGCSNLTINCMFESEPSGWNADWNKLNYSNGKVPVVWGYKGE